MRSRLARLAPVSTDGIAAVHGIKSVRVAEEVVPVSSTSSRLPEIFATRCGSIESSKQASMIEAVIESCPQPAHRVEILPS